MGKKSGFTSAEIEEIKRLYLQEGRSILQIPKILGKGSENSVRNALHKARVKHAPEERTKLERFKPDQVFGNITIKGKSEPVKFTAQVNGDKVNTKLTFDRTKFDVRYGSGKFFDNLGDRAIYDNFAIKFKLAATK